MRLKIQKRNVLDSGRPLAAPTAKIWSRDRLVHPSESYRPTYAYYQFRSSRFGTYKYKPSIWRPCHTCQCPEIRCITINKPTRKVRCCIGGHNEMAYCSAKASISRKHPSSEIAATYLTSGLKIKSAVALSSLFYRVYNKALTHNTATRNSPMTDRISRSLLFIRFSSVACTSPGDWMPWRYCHEHIVQWIPFLCG
jgi:hypothetical protein